MLLIRLPFYPDAYQEQIKQEREHRLAVQRELDQLRGT